MEKQPVSSTLRMVDPLDGKEGTVFDKAAPSGPPTPPVRSIPPHLKKLVLFMESKIADESLLLDLCVDRCVGIVKFNYEKRLVGSDFFGEQPSAAHFIGMAAPLAVELYKQVLAAIVDDKDAYAALLVEAQKEMERGSRPASKILTP